MLEKPLIWSESTSFSLQYILSEVPKTCSDVGDGREWSPKRAFIIPEYAYDFLYNILVDDLGGVATRVFRPPR